MTRACEVASCRPLPPLVGLLGRKRSGKDSLAEVLVGEFGFARVAFADPLKEAALGLDPLVGPTGLPFAPARVMRRLSEVVDSIGWERAKEVPEVRRTLQRLGTEAIRALDEGFWVRIAMRAVRELREGPAPATYPARAHARGVPVVVTDVRLSNEAEAIQEAGGALVRIVRPGVESGDSHASEVALDDWPTNYVVVNDGTLDDLRAEARALARTLLY